MNYIIYKKKIKIIPYNIYDLLIPIALAHWIMGDGAKRNKGLVLCTDSFSISDVVRLSNVLRIKYGLNTTITGFTNNKHPHPPREGKGKNLHTTRKYA